LLHGCQGHDGAIVRGAERGTFAFQHTDDPHDDRSHAHLPLDGSSVAKSVSATALPSTMTLLPRS
jgi:hypothetical protein